MISVFLAVCLFYKLSFVNMAVTLRFLQLPLFLLSVYLTLAWISSEDFFNCVEVNPISGVQIFSWNIFLSFLLLETSKVVQSKHVLEITHT